MARPGGNPDLEKYQFEQKYGWEKSCKVTIGLRVPKDWKDRLYAVEGWQEKLRGALAQILEESETDSPQAQLNSTSTENAHREADLFEIAPTKPGQSHKPQNNNNRF